MGFSLTSPAPEKCDPTAKNRVRGFFGDAQQSHRENSPQPKQPRQGDPPSLTKTVSGRTYWPSRDPIGEGWKTAEFNLYGFCLNQPTNGVDVKGEWFWIPIVAVLYLIETANAPDVDDPPNVPQKDPIKDIPKIIMEVIPDPVSIAEEILEEETGVNIPGILPTKKNIKDVCCTIFKGEKGFRALSRHLNWDRKTQDRASENLHQAKKGTGRGGADNIEMCAETGDIIDPVSGEVIGNLND